MAGINIFQQQDFTGGLNLRSDQFQLADNESPKMLNVEIDPRGGVFSRGGMQRINTTAVTGGTWQPEKLTAFYGATPHVMLATQTKLYKSTGSNFTALQWNNAGTPTDILAASPHGPCVAAWGATLYIATGASGSNGGYRWSTGDAYATPLTASGSNPDAWQQTRGTPSTGSAKIPQAEHLCVHANKMFAANTNEDGVSFPNRLRWSHDLIPDNWHASDYIDINSGGNGIVGMAVANGQLLIFKPNAIYVLYGYEYNSFKLVELTNSIGAQSHHAICSTDTGVYFFSLGRGLFFTDGNNIVDVFKNVRPLIDLGYISSANAEGVSVSWVGGRVWLSLPYSTTGTIPSYPTINLVFDPTLGAYTMFQTGDGYGVIGGCDFRSAGVADLRLMIHPTQPRVLSVDRYGDSVDNINGSAIGFPSYYRTKWFDGGSYMQKKMFRRPEIVMREAETPQIVNVKVYHDFNETDSNWRRQFDIAQSGNATSLWGTAVWAQTSESAGASVWSSGAASSVLRNGKNLGLAKTVQLQFTGQSGEPWGINSIGYKFNSRRVTG